MLFFFCFEIMYVHFVLDAIFTTSLCRLDVSCVTSKITCIEYSEKNFGDCYCLCVCLICACLCLNESINLCTYIIKLVHMGV